MMQRKWCIDVGSPHRGERMLHSFSITRKSRIYTRTITGPSKGVRQRGRSVVSQEKESKREAVRGRGKRRDRAAVYRLEKLREERRVGRCRKVVRYRRSPPKPSYQGYRDPIDVSLLRHDSLRADVVTDVSSHLYKSRTPRPEGVTSLDVLSPLFHVGGNNVFNKADIIVIFYTHTISFWIINSIIGENYTVATTSYQSERRSLHEMASWWF